VIADSQSWYIIPVANGFQFINWACTERALTTYGGTAISTTNCGVGYIDYGTVWQLEDQQVAISYYYDNGFQQRYSNRWNDTIFNVTSMQADIAEIVENVFGIGVKMESPTYKQSYADLCSAAYNANCTSHATTTNCKNYNTAKALSTAHHKNFTANLQYVYNGKTDANRHKLFVMFSGHVPCGEDEGVHAYDSVAGVAIRGYNVCTVYRNGNGTASDNTIYRDQYTALHEISHCLGAETGDGLTPDTVHENGVCVMSYERKTSDLENYWKARSSLLYCDKCLPLIQNYLSNSSSSDS
jgi:hypothetical protein